MNVAIGSDHAGFRIKEVLIEELSGSGLQIMDCGTKNADSVDYPDFAGEVCRLVTAGTADLGIVICSTGIGVSIAANKMRGIRAALCHTEFSAAMARSHNDANVLAIGGNVVGDKLAVAIAKTFLAEPFSKGERHIRRIAKIRSLEDGCC